MQSNLISQFEKKLISILDKEAEKIEQKTKQQNNQPVYKEDSLSIAFTAVQKMPVRVKKILENSFYNIMELSIMNCDLRTFENFPKLQKLKSINVSKNSLRGSFEFLVKNRSIQYIDVSHNIINDIKKFEPLRCLKNLSLYAKDNPFSTKQQQGYTKSMSDQLKHLGLKYLDKPITIKNEVKNQDKIVKSSGKIAQKIRRKQEMLDNMSRVRGRPSKFIGRYVPSKNSGEENNDLREVEPDASRVRLLTMRQESQSSQSEQNNVRKFLNFRQIMMQVKSRVQQNLNANIQQRLAQKQKERQRQIQRLRQQREQRQQQRERQRQMERAIQQRQLRERRLPRQLSRQSVNSVQRPNDFNIEIIPNILDYNSYESVFNDQNDMPDQDSEGDIIDESNQQMEQIENELEIDDDDMEDEQILTFSRFGSYSPRPISRGRESNTFFRVTTQQAEKPPNQNLQDMLPIQNILNIHQENDEDDSDDPMIWPM